jgi:hypothetical protein
MVRAPSLVLVGPIPRKVVPNGSGLSGGPKSKSEGWIVDEALLQKALQWRADREAACKRREKELEEEKKLRGNQRNLTKPGA